MALNAEQGGRRRQSADVSQNARAGGGGVVEAAKPKPAAQLRQSLPAPARPLNAVEKR